MSPSSLRRQTGAKVKPRADDDFRGEDHDNEKQYGQSWRSVLLQPSPLNATIG